MRFALRHHLLIWLLTPQLVLWLAAALVTYSVAARHADFAVDRSLFKASKALARQVKPMGSGLLVDFPRAARDILETDPDEQIYYMVSSPPGHFILGNRRLPAPPPTTETGPDAQTFYDATLIENDASIAVRIAAISMDWGEPDSPQRMVVQVAKSRNSHQQVVKQILWDTAVPLSILVLIMSVLVWAGIRSGLSPLAKLRETVSGRAPGNLAPLQLEVAPEEVRDLVAALNTLLAAVQDSLVQQRRFINDAAHQLRTPLAGLKSQAELAIKALEHGNHPDPSLHVRLELVLESAARSSHLITQLLALARAEPESAATVGQEVFDLHQLAREVTAEWVPRALAARIDLGMDEPQQHDNTANSEAHETVATSLKVLGHPLLIREAIVNLLDNAIRYAGPHTEVTVRVQAATDQIILDVDDTGPGVDSSLLPRIFERFVRGSQDGGGCGLGLAIVREIILRHGGNVRLEPLVPHGLRARIQLPRATLT
jgi:two-component system sensor histidine kinase TctE